MWVIRVAVHVVNEIQTCFFHDDWWRTVGRAEDNIVSAVQWREATCHLKESKGNFISSKFLVIFIQHVWSAVDHSVSEDPFAVPIRELCCVWYTVGERRSFWRFDRNTPEGS